MNCFGNLLNDIWRMVRFNMYVLDYAIWFLVGSVSAVVEIKSDIQIIYYFMVHSIITSLKVTSKLFTIFMEHSIITSKPLFLNTFCRRFLIFFICGPLQSLKIDNTSSLYKPTFFVSYCCPNKFNKNIPVNSHTFAAS